MVKKIILGKFILLVLIINGCQQEVEYDNESERFFSDPQLVEKLTNKAIDEGDTITFEKVFDMYYSDARGGQFLYSTLTMAHKYNYPKAYYYAYLILASEGHFGTYEHLDKKTQKLALYYLTLSYEKGYDNAKSELNAILGNVSKMPSSSYFLMKYDTLGR